MRVITIFSPLRIFVPVALVSLAIGVGYGAWTAYDHYEVADTAVLLITLAVVVLLIGLVSEQISALRFDGRK